MRYDYVIVGGGAAGCVLAERLSRRADRTVLLLEAGPRDTHPMIHMPKGVAKVLGNPSYIWPFQVQSSGQSNAPPMTWVRGKTLGGSSAINGMMYVRGQPADFDELARQTGPAWNWAEIGSAYRELERHELGPAETRGAAGLLRISLPSRNGILDRVIASAQGLGLDRQADVNEPDNKEKVGYCPRTIWRGRRQSAAVAFLGAAAKRSNLTIQPDVLVDRVVFEGRRAVAVACQIGGVEKEFAGNRIILSAGTLGSPAVLQRSGIGDAASLRSLGIEVLVDRPAVGQNLREHCALALQWRLRDGPSHNKQFAGWRLLLNGIRYYLSRTGVLASGAYDVGGWFKTRPGLDRPNAQFIAAPFSIDKTRSKAQMVMERHRGMQVAVYPLRPRSTGEVRIVSRDPAVLPAATLDYFADPEDRREMVEAVRFVRAMAQQGPLADIIDAETRPGAAAETDEEILDVYRELGTCAYHAAGTCRMGTDPDAVLDPLTQVRGVDNLHVVDLSIAPFVVAGNTFGPVAAMAWRAADLIEALPA